MRTIHEPRYIEKRDYESKIGKIRVEEGYTISELCRISNVHTTQYSSLQNGMMSPYIIQGKETGQVRPSAERLLAVLGCTLSQAFPRYSCELDRSALTNEQELEIIVSEETRNATDTEALYNRASAKAAVIEIMQSVTSRQEFVLDCRFFQELTLEETGRLMGVSGNMARIIEQAALRKIRKAHRLKPLRKFKELQG